jgi:hypothetical protein
MENTALMCLSLAPTSGESTTTAATKVVHADGTVTRLARPVRASDFC